MKKIREELDEILLKVNATYDLAELLEDYFLRNPLIKNDDFRKTATLSHINVEKNDELRKDLETLWDLLIKSNEK